MNIHVATCDQAASLFAEREGIFTQMEAFGVAPIPADLGDKSHMLIEAVSFARPTTIAGVLACLHAAEHFASNADDAEPDSCDETTARRARDRCIKAAIAALEVLR